MRTITLTVFVFLFAHANAQNLPLKNTESGIFSLGSRSTVSLFNENQSSIGMGVGGQFRLQLAPQLNTEWFFDYLTSNVSSTVHRTDFHIGWSVMYYPIKNKSSILVPYLAAGHCFDQSFFLANQDESNSLSRFSSAVQFGSGVHVNLSPRIDITVLGQYMVHLGREITPTVENSMVSFYYENHSGLEGHLLLTLGINYKIKDLW